MLDAQPDNGLRISAKAGPRFISISKEEIPPGEVVRLYSFVSDGREVFGNIIVETSRRRVAERDNVSLVERIKDFSWYPAFEGASKPPWALDGLTDLEAVVVAILAQIAYKDISLFERMLHSPLLNDGVTESEKGFFVHLTALAKGIVFDPDAEDHSQLVEVVLEQPWVADGITENEGKALETLI